MIIEGIISTRNAEGAIHFSAMGPHVDFAESRLELRPFQPSTTLDNLKTHPEGVFHIVDDACLIAKLAIRHTPITFETEQASQVSLPAMRDCCRRLEFSVQHLDLHGQRANIQCAIVHDQNIRPFSGFNRANHALIEASILATRISFLPSEFVTQELVRLEEIVAKTGNPEHEEAMALIREHVSAAIS